jgi:hypothetical protein
MHGPTEAERCKRGKCVVRAKWFIIGEKGVIQDVYCDLHLPDGIREVMPGSDGTVLVEVMGKGGGSARDQEESKRYSL